MYPAKIDNGGYVYSLVDVVLSTIDGREYVHYSSDDSPYGDIWLPTNYPRSNTFVHAVKEIA